MTAAPALASRHCKTCSSKDKLDEARLGEHLTQVPKWTLRGGHIERAFAFADFYETMAFANAVAWIANQEDHHPEIEVSYKKCVVRYSTHSAQGLTENDFICAAKIDRLISGRES